MFTFTAIGMDDSVNTCDCCGKSNLKATVMMERCDGEMFSYGTTCAARNTGKVQKQINKEIKDFQEKQVIVARKEFMESNEQKAYQAKLATANNTGVKIGKEFAEFCKVESDCADAKRREIANKYKLNFYGF